MFRKFVLATLIACTILTPVSAQKFGKKGGIGSTDSTIPAGGGEPTGGTYSINGDTGAATLKSVIVAGPISATGTVTGSNISGTNTGDQINIPGNSATSTKLANPRTINGVSFDGSSNITINAVDTIARLANNANLSDVANVDTARSNLLAAKSGSNSDITSLSGLTTALSVAQGGTGSTTPADALVALGAQGLSSNLTSLAGLSTSSDKCLYWTGSASASLFTCTNYGRGLIASANASSAQTALGLGSAATYAIGTSGATIPLLNGSNVWANGQIFSSIITGSISGNAVTATKLSTSRTISVTGDSSWSLNFDGSANVTTTSNLSTTGVTAGSYTNANITVDEKGRITSASNGTAGSGTPTGSPPPESGYGTVKSVSVATANGISGSVANPTTTPEITLSLGAITPSSVNASGTVLGSNLSGTNTGDQTNVTGNAGTATKLATARNINGVPFDGTAAITINAVDNTARLAVANNLSDVANPTTARTNIGAAASGANTDITSITGSAAKWTTGRTLSISGDLTYTSPLIDGTGNVIAAGTLATSGVTAGSYTNANITVDSKGRVTSAANGSAGNAGTVTSVSVTTANGVSGTVANATTTPAISLSLGAITPSSVAATGMVTGSNLSGTNTGDQTIALSGDVSGSGTGSITTTLATVNSNVGTFGSVAAVPVIGVNGKGLITSVSTAALGTAAAANTGTSGLTIPYLNGTNSWSGTQTFQLTNPAPQLNVDRSTDDNVSPILAIRKSRGTFGSPTSIANGDAIGNIQMFGYDGTAWRRTNQIRVLSDGPISTGVIPTKMELTTTSLTGTHQIAATLTNTGSLNVLNGISTTTGTFTGALTASNFSGTSSGTNTGDQTITLSGDITGSGTGAITTVLPTVNSNVGTFGSATQIPQITVNGKGQVTAVTTVAASGGSSSPSYAEGTFTPVLSFSSGSNNATYNTQRGYYTKIGAQVTVTLFIVLNSKGTGTGYLFINGLPFTSKSGISSVGTVLAYGITGSNNLVSEVPSGGTSIVINSVTDGDFSRVTSANVSNDAEIQITLSYFSAS